MFLLLLQMLLISCPAATAQRGEQQNQKRRRRPALLPHGRHLPMDYEEIRAKPSLFVAEPPAETESNKTVDETKISTFIFPYIEDGRPVQDLGSWTPAGEFPDSEDTASPPSHPHSKREVESPFRKDARRFWDLFMLKTKSRSEELVLPIKTNEMYQETCSSLPFSQSIVHENCEKVVIQNKLCFGKCSSFHIPGPEDRLYTFCSHCLPTKFSMKHLEMNCTKASPVIKMIMIVEECKCEVQKTKTAEIGFLHSNLHANVYEHN